VLVEQLKGRTDRTGQFVLPIVEVADNPDALFEEAQAAEEAQEVVAAEKLYRRVIKLDPDDPAAAFNLGNLLRAADRKVDARRSIVPRSRPIRASSMRFYNLADLLDDQGRTKEAIGFLRKAARCQSGTCGLSVQHGGADAAARGPSGGGRLLAALSPWSIHPQSGRCAPSAR